MLTKVVRQGPLLMYDPVVEGLGGGRAEVALFIDGGVCG